jgi:hypothetical protein
MSLNQRIAEAAERERLKSAPAGASTNGILHGTINLDAFAGVTFTQPRKSKPSKASSQVSLGKLLPPLPRRTAAQPAEEQSAGALTLAVLEAIEAREAAMVRLLHLSSTLQALRHSLGVRRSTGRSYCRVELSSEFRDAQVLALARCVVEFRATGLRVVEAVEAWREAPTDATSHDAKSHAESVAAMEQLVLGGSKPPPLPFVWQGHNYLVRMTVPPPELPLPLASDPLLVHVMIS